MGNVWSSFVGLLEQLLVWSSTMTGSIGIGIILFTIAVRLVILPVTLTSIRSSRKMQQIQPQIKELQRKYGTNPQRLQEEMVGIYKQYKINPASGCLPLLVQLPFFIGVYQAVNHLMQQRENLNEVLRNVVNGESTTALLQQPVLGWLWRLVPNIEHVSIPALLDQPFLGLHMGTAAFTNNFTSFNGAQYLVLPILSVVLQLGQQVMAMPRVMDPQQKSMMQTMLVMPLVFGYIAFIFPTGAVFYWVTSSLVGIVQQYFTSGWGSLANYLKFLPPDRAAKSATVVSATGPSASGGLIPANATAGAGTTATPAEPATRRSFWDVMEPLLAIDDPAQADTTSTPDNETGSKSSKQR